MNRSANAALAKVRAMYGQMLTRTQYDDLIRRQSVQEISAYLPVPQRKWLQPA